MSFHMTIVEGNLGADPEVVEFESGNKVVNFPVAVNEKFINRAGEKVERVTWYRVQAWGNTGKAVADYKEKGDPVVVIGNMRYDPGRDENGEEIKDGCYYPKLVAQQVKFISTGNGNLSLTEERVLTSDTPRESELDPMDKIPF